jgi:hypothetical protein
MKVGDSRVVLSSELKPELLEQNVYSFLSTSSRVSPQYRKGGVFDSGALNVVIEAIDREHKLMALEVHEDIFALHESDNNDLSQHAILDATHRDLLSKKVNGMYRLLVHQPRPLLTEAYILR